MHNTVRQFLKNGVYDQHLIFKTLYPKWNGHYSHLRNIISEVKNEGIG